MNIKLWFVANSTMLIVLLSTNKILAVTEIIIEKHRDEVLLRSHTLTVLSPLNNLTVNLSKKL